MIEIKKINREWRIVVTLDPEDAEQLAQCFSAEDGFAIDLREAVAAIQRCRPSYEDG